MKVTRIPLLILIAAIALPIAGEFAVRTFPTLLPADGQIRMQAIMMKDKVLPDNEIGFVRLPGQRQQVKTMDFSYLRETDSRGFPNRDPWPARADIVILGDSLVMGEGTGLDDSFVGRFQRANADVKVVNLGIAGAGPDRQLLAYRKFGAQLNPSVVLAFLYLAADITNSEHFDLWRREAPGSDYNRFRLDLGRSKQPRNWLDRSRLIGVVKGHFGAREPASQVIEAADGSRVFLEERTLSYVQRELSNDEIERLIKPLTSLRQLTKAQGASVYVVLIPSKEEIFGNADSVVNQVGRAFRGAGIKYIDLYPLIEQRTKARSPYFSRDIHLNEFGNQVVADYLTQWWQRRSDSVGRSQVTLSTNGGSLDQQ